MVESVWYRSNLFKANSVPLFNDLPINFQERAQATTIMLGDNLMQKPVNKELECDSLYSLAEEDQVVALAYDWDVFFLDRWSSG